VIFGRGKGTWGSETPNKKWKICLKKIVSYFLNCILFSLPFEKATRFSPHFPPKNPQKKMPSGMAPLKRRGFENARNLARLENVAFHTENTKEGLWTNSYKFSSHIPSV